MGYSSERMIELHNENMLDPNYAEDYCREMEMEELWQRACDLENEKFINWFDDYRISFDGYEEFDEPIFENQIDEDLSF